MSPSFRPAFAAGIVSSKLGKINASRVSQLVRRNLRKLGIAGRKEMEIRKRDQKEEMEEDKKIRQKRRDDG